MNCPQCKNEMIKARATSVGEEYDYCRGCKKELAEMQPRKGIRNHVAEALEVVSDILTATQAANNRTIPLPPPSVGGPAQTNRNPFSSAPSPWSTWILGSSQKCKASATHQQHCFGAPTPVNGEACRCGGVVWCTLTDTAVILSSPILSPPKQLTLMAIFTRGYAPCSQLGSAECHNFPGSNPLDLCICGRWQFNSGSPQPYTPPSPARTGFSKTA